MEDPAEITAPNGKELSEARRAVTELENARITLVTTYARSGLDPDLLGDAVGRIEDDLSVARQYLSGLEDSRATKARRRAGWASLQQAMLTWEWILDYPGTLDPVEQGKIYDALELKALVVDRTTFEFTATLPDGSEVAF